MTPEEFENHVPDISFQFMVFQPYPQKDILYMYLDGSESRRVINIHHFLNFCRLHCPEVGKEVIEACRTTSFYLFSLPDKTVTHLFPKGDDVPYKDNLAGIFKEKRQGKEPRHLVAERTTLEEALMDFGFAAPSEDSIRNLKVNMVKKSETKDSLMGRLFGRFK